jgi:chromate reductase
MDTQQPIRIVGFAGSLRAGSYNAAALRAAKRLAPAGLEIDIVPIDAVPLYNEDVRAAGYPAPVQALRDRVRAADGVLIATPEYNYSMPGVLKNAIDWASRPPEQPFDGKPVGIISASMGMLGGSRAQYHLRQSMVFLNAMVMNRPEVFIPAAQTKFDAAGELTDAPTRDFLAAFLTAFQAWVVRHRGAAQA